jgi:hypothetical protein
MLADWGVKSPIVRVRSRTPSRYRFQVSVALS